MAQITTRISGLVARKKFEPMNQQQTGPHPYHTDPRMPDSSVRTRLTHATVPSAFKRLSVIPGLYDRVMRGWDTTGFVCNGVVAKYTPVEFNWWAREKELVEIADFFQEAMTANTGEQQ